MGYTNSITSKGQITIPKAYRDKLGLGEVKKGYISLNDRNEIVITRPRTPAESLARIREILAHPTNDQPLTEREKLIGGYLAKKYNVKI